MLYVVRASSAPQCDNKFQPSAHRPVLRCYRTAVLPFGHHRSLKTTLSSSLGNVSIGTHCHSFRAIRRIKLISNGFGEWDQLCQVSCHFWRSLLRSGCLDLTATKHSRDFGTVLCTALPCTGTPTVPWPATRKLEAYFPFSGACII